MSEFRRDRGSRQRLGLVTIAVVAAFLASCSSNPSPVPMESSARAALERGLTSWKAGETGSSLLKGTPGVEFIDYERRAGLALVEFVVKDDEIGQGTRTISASLTLKGRAPKEVKYMILGGDPIQLYRDEDFTRAMNMENNPVSVKKHAR